MTLFFVSLFLILILSWIWLKEARIFLFLFHRLFFLPRKGTALPIGVEVAFPQRAQLENSWRDIRQELNQAMGDDRSLPRFHEVDKSNHKISFNDGPAWRTVIIKAYDGWFEENCKRFPNTTQLLKNIPSISTAMFSILEPGVVIPPHSGKFSGLFRYHLGIAVPVSDRCYMVVNGEKYHWKEGEGVLFNDTFLHSVTNDTEEIRIVLFLDIKKRGSRVFQLMDTFILSLIRLSPVYKRARISGELKD